MRFLRAWIRSLQTYQAAPDAIIPFIQKKLGVKDPALAKRMYEDDAPYILPGGRLGADAAKEIVEIGREALRVKEAVPVERVFDFSLAQEAAKELRVSLARDVGAFPNLN